MKSKVQQERIERLFNRCPSSYAVEFTAYGYEKWEDLSKPLWNWDIHDYRIKNEIQTEYPDGVLIISRNYYGGMPEYKSYYKNDKLHREDGPADIWWPMIGDNIREEYYINGERLSAEFFANKYLRWPKQYICEKQYKNLDEQEMTIQNRQLRSDIEKIKASIPDRISEVAALAVKVRDITGFVKSWGGSSGMSISDTSSDETKQLVREWRELNEIKEDIEKIKFCLYDIKMWFDILETDHGIEISYFKYPQKRS